MRILRFISSTFVAAVCCAVPALAADTPPAVNLAVLQHYSRGNSTIAGTTRFSKEGTAFCAPDVPYVNWYVSQLNSPRKVIYAGMLARYTRTARIGKDGAFTCTNLARGRYLVWIEGTRRVGGNYSTEPQERDEQGTTTGQVTGTTTTSTVRNPGKAAYGGDTAAGAAPFFTAPKHVLVGAGVTQVSL